MALMVGKFLTEAMVTARGVDQDRSCKKTQVLDGQHKIQREFAKACRN